MVAMKDIITMAMEMIEHSYVNIERYFCTMEGQGYGMFG